MTSAYAIAWIGELGGIQNIQIASEAPETISRLGKWPVPVLIHEAEGKTFAAASAACMAKLRDRIPEWERFIRSRTRMKPIAPALAAVAAARARKR
jgi:hypothetical protein